MAGMVEFYPQIKAVHVTAVLASGGLFAVRGLLVLAGSRLPMAAPVRYLSYGIDIVLLTAALMLTAVVHQYPFVHGWLTAKVLLLAAYIALGSFALKRAHTRRGRALCFVAALGVYAFMIGVARAHHPLGVLAGAS